MTQNNKTFFLLLLLMIPLLLFAQKQLMLKSPDGKLQASITIDRFISYSVVHNGDVLIEPSVISMKLNDGKSFGISPQLKSSSTQTINQIISASVYKKNTIIDNYNELTLKFDGDYNIIFRAYNEGIAYRFVSLLKKPFTVENERAEFNFPADNNAYIAYVNKSKDLPFDKQFNNSFENTYAYTPLSKWEKNHLAFLPTLIESSKGRKICITEADLLNYPGMYIYNSKGASSLEAVFAPCPKDIEQGGHNMLQGMIKSRESYIARYEKGTSFPWRIIIVTDNDRNLADNDMVYKLATPADRNADFSWVKPGKVAWDWWNDWNLYGVDFRAGINNETYKYYIDFASKHNIQYVILDEGWAVNLKADLMQVIPEINLKELIAYANDKNVGLILWAGYYAFNRDLEQVCKHYSEMGIKGFKVDFMDRDDQPMVDFCRRAAETTAKYKLLVDFHGMYKPTGMQRTYPNAMNYEGVFGLEQLKWSSATTQVDYDVTIPFIRMVAGPMDYTQGAMRNATKNNYKSVYTEPMSQGTRCHQLAMYVIFESPLNMLCDNPANYIREVECTNFIASIPEIWEKTIALSGEVSKYVALARKKGDNWYVGALTNWDARRMELDLSFLGEGNFAAEVFKDGINADRAAQDYKKEIIDIPSNKKLAISMAPGGGYVMRIYKK